MFFLRWITRLISLLPLWIGQALSMLKTPMCIPFLRAAWWIAGNGEDGRIFLVALYKHKGLSVGLEESKRCMERRPSPQIAAWTGALALEAGDTELARTMLLRGHELGDDPAGGLDVLELYLPPRDSQQAADEIISKLDARRDLSPQVSKILQRKLLWKNLLKGEIEDGRRRAEFLLKIEEAPEARMALWVTAKLAGNETAAKAQRDQMKMPQANRMYFEVLGYAIIGDFAEAHRLLEQLRESNASLAEQAEQILKNKEAVACSG